ncbi:hypothetical protein BGW80DRAFT_1467263 [Lactifluus volemus]|nr:hypothetical protein BGW80DRAFT_1467263 [Lactifluus volemus]
MAASSSTVLPSLSKFDIRNTLPELQDDFRSLWDEIEHAPTDELLCDSDILTSTAPGPSHITVDAADESSLGGISEPMRRPSTVTTWSDPTPHGGQSRSGTSQGVVAAATTGNNIANNLSRDHLRFGITLIAHLPDGHISLFLYDSNGSIFRYRPHVAGAAPLIVYHDTQARPILQLSWKRSMVHVGRIQLEVVTHRRVPQVVSWLRQFDSVSTC